MALDLSPFADTGLDAALLEALSDEHERATLPELRRLWAYFRNSATLAGCRGTRSAACPENACAREYCLAQERGLPRRLRGQRTDHLRDDRGSEREVVIENDIAWRVEALVDFVFGKPARILSTTGDETRRAEIEAILDSAWEASGGAALFQDFGLLGGVYGFADLVLRDAALWERAGAPAVSRTTARASLDRALAAARLLRIELVEPPRAIPLLDGGDYRRILAYIIRAPIVTNDIERPGVFRRVLGSLRAGAPGTAPRRRTATALEVISPRYRQVYIDNALIDEGPNHLGELPVVHVQNISQPLRYEGISDVEPLIPLQDELNTRLSDRAHRVTLQSFNMYLVKGLDALGPSGLRIAPGQVWMTDNPDASVQGFGGDGHSPSEERHIEELRDAMDKISGVSPVAIGVIRAKLGHLSSENALRITLMGVLSKAARKRLSYGRGIAQMSRLILKALDAAGVYRTTEAERSVRIEWSDPLPVDERARLTAAQLKRDLGVPQEQVLAELGYAPRDSGIV